MDLATLGGLLIALIALVVSEAMEGSSVHELISVSALLLICGGTLGATVISYALSDVTALPRAILSTLLRSKGDAVAIVRKLVAVADKARREGLLALQDEAEGVTHPILRRGLMLVADGVDPSEVESALSSQASLMEQAAHRHAAMMETAGGYAPTIGIIGTVSGLVRVLGNMEDQSKLAGQIAVAFLATLYGIATANLFWLPLGGKLKRNAQSEAHLNELVLEGIMAIQSGAMPRLVEVKLSMYLTPKEQARLGAAKEAAKGGGDEK